MLESEVQVADSCGAQPHHAPGDQGTVSRRRRLPWNAHAEALEVELKTALLQHENEQTEWEITSCLQLPNTTTLSVSTPKSAMLWRN